MTLQRARVIKGAFPVDPAGSADDGRQLDPTRIGPPLAASPLAPSPSLPSPVAAAAAARARRIAREVLDARAEADRILADARRQADAVVTSAADAAAAEAREKEVARLAAGFLALRDEEARRAERDVDRTIELAVLLAERLVGDALRIEPARIAELAASAIQEARGARRVRIDACPEDVSALEEALGAVGQIADIQPDPTLERGSLVVHTDLGRVDARLRPQLTRLAESLREALR
jgi:flagellar biosynthesis/type III secretory pathway protein FliH